MPQFTYSARSKTGELISGSVAAATLRAAIEEVRRLGCQPINIEAETAASASSLREAGRGGIDILVFTRQLARLLESGVSLARGLELLSTNSPNQAARSLSAQLLDAVRSGSPFNEAIAARPDVFPELYSGMIRSGEASGALPSALRRLADHYEKRRLITTKIWNSLTYPIFILGVGLITVMFLIAFVIPKFQQVFDDLGQTMPPPTQLLISLGNFSSSKWWAILAAIALIAFAARRSLQSEPGKRSAHRLALSAPGVGALVRMAALGRFTRVLGVLLQNGVPILHAIELAAANTGNSEISRRLIPLRAATEEGVPVSVSFLRSGLFDALTVDITTVAEETGTLPQSLLEIADHFDDEVLTALQRVMSVIEPALIVMIGVLVAFIVSAMLLPILQLNLTSL